MSTSADNADAPLHWPAIAALYAGVLLGIAGMLHVGLYRNAAWLVLLGTGGALTAYGHMCKRRGDKRAARRWKRAAGLTYGVFFLWVGTVLLSMLLGR